jgi:hypothetical protein
LKAYSQQILLVLVTAGLYTFYFLFTESVDFENCSLCDAKEYKKFYDYFETGESQQIKYPFYTRPVAPFLASIIPGNNVTNAFHVINLIFILLSVLTINKLWDIMDIKSWLKWIGFGWLLTHWTGLIRYNLFDNVTIDVPLYFVQPLALILYFQRKFKWFYLLTPLALLQKESFLAIGLVFLVIHIWLEKGNWFVEGRHLLYSLLIGILIQQVVLSLLPEQLDQRNSLMAILYHGKLAIDDPTRFIRWFAAFGSSFGVIPFIVAFKARSIKFQDQRLLTLFVLSTMYCSFGLLAGEDMTRILFLGFPFIMTISLLSFQNESKWMVLLAVLLSTISLHLYPFPVDNTWSVDYASLDFVFQRTAYYLIAAIIFFVSFVIFRKRKSTL